MPNHTVYQKRGTTSIRGTLIFTVILLFCVLIKTASAGHLHHEKYYQDNWCDANSGQAEYRLPDRTRCDCLTSTHAVEVDFAPKWYEAIGQSLYYSLQTGKRSGILLIIESDDDRKYWLRMNSTILHFGLPIDTWMVDGR